MTNSYTAITPDVTVNTATTPNVSNADVLSTPVTPEELAALRAMRANPDIAAKIKKTVEKSESEGASAVRGKLIKVIEDAQRDALALALKNDPENESFIEGAREYIDRVGKITTTAHLAPDGELQVVTKSPRKKQEKSESTASA